MDTLKQLVATDPVAMVLLVLGIAGYLFVGLAPFNFDFGRPWHFQMFWVTPINGTLNLVCFVPIGFLTARLVPESPLLAGFALCAAVSFCVEALQVYLPGRYPLLSDWLLNTTGGTLGALAWVYGQGASGDAVLP